MNDRKTHVLGLTRDALAAELAALGMARFRAQQVLEWIYQKRATTFEQMTNLSLADRQALGERYTLFVSEVVREVRAVDGTEKVLVKWGEGSRGRGVETKGSRGQGVEGSSEGLAVLAEGGAAGESDTQARALPGGARGEEGVHARGAAMTEAVLIPCDDDECDEFGNVTVAHRRTACLSTQVGCPVGCAFCASGLGGWQGNLTTGQIVEEALRLVHRLPAERRLTNVVFMGMGEPLANFEATVGAVRTLMADWAFHISARKITVSTVGLPPQMKKLADLEIPVTLAISLHAPNDALRRQIIPWAGKIPLDKIVDAGRYYFEKTGREVTLEYIMLDGVNTLPEHARQLAGVARGLRANVNLIYYNEVPGLPFKRPSGAVMFGFQNVLRAARVNVHVRKSRGREIAAACGQLARQEGTGEGVIDN